MEILNNDATNVNAGAYNASTMASTNNVKVVEKVVEKAVPITKVVEKVETVPILPDRPLSQGELDWLMYQARANHREIVVASVLSGFRTLCGIGMIFGLGWGLYKIYKDVCETENKKTEDKADFVDTTGYTSV